jgi:hypothetical protein
MSLVCAFAVAAVTTPAAAVPAMERHDTIMTLAPLLSLPQSRDGKARSLVLFSYRCVAVALAKLNTLVPQKFRTDVSGVVCERCGTFTEVITNLEETTRYRKVDCD